MTSKPSDLIAIANPQLAEKLAEEKLPKHKRAKPDSEDANTKSTDGAIASKNEAEQAHKTYLQEIWRAVFTLNIFRYLFSLTLIGLGLSTQLISNFKPLKELQHPQIFTSCAIVLLISAVLFTILTRNRGIPLRVLLLCQFVIDTIAAGFIVHSTGSISSSFSLVFFLIVITGSVVLRRKDALALAAGSIIIIFFEHFYSVLLTADKIEWRFDSLAMYGIVLMAVGAGISHLARLVRRAEVQSFVPGNESIDDYLVREEINALKSALEATDGNKTEAAKLLGMTFRSFRYKLSKYEI